MAANIPAPLAHHPGMGSIRYPGGIAFRVWAPFASEVFVAGAFNQWSDSANPFVHEGKGYWYTEVPEAEIGDEYKFVLQNGDQKPIWRNNPYASEMVHSGGNAVLHDPKFDWTGDDFTMPAWNELVIYEMHVGTFNDTFNREPGTFESIITKLPYLEKLGINAIEIMPVAEFPVDHSWGYNPAYPFSVEKALGGPQGLYQLVKAAHQHGIAVILDVVYNHFGPSDLDQCLWRFDDWSNAEHDGGIYFYDKKRVYTRWGHTRPDYGRKEVRQYLRDNALFWLNKYRLDGLRFDSTVNIHRHQHYKDGPWSDLPDGWGLIQWINNNT
ncbi:MAG: 1,4-alpha-glucan branching protein, partial [Candidatus Electrothrix sp. ATG2]|nr:1,4-alpha-glucan branching protein [Candidatus Electrothrix sp. ATG2]